MSPVLLLTASQDLTGLQLLLHQQPGEEWSDLASYIRHEDFRLLLLRPSSVTLTVPPLDSEMGWTGELWSKTKSYIRKGKYRPAPPPLVYVCHAQGTPPEL